jgi:PBP4 family serine-type D-alanyl-D-alanine carboxypeptidase
MTISTEQHSQTLATHLDAILSRPVLQRSQVGIAFYDVHEERFVYERDADVLFAGASTTKILTCLGALSRLGPEYRFETKVVRTGDIDRNGVLQGDLVLVASGDPNLSGRINGDTLDFCNYDHALAGAGYDARVVDRDPLLVIEALAEQIVQSGVRHISGTIAVDLGAFADAGPEPGTGAYISAIAINDNLIDLEFTGGGAEGAAVQIASSPAIPCVRFVNRLVTSAAGTAADVRIVDLPSEQGRLVEIAGKVPSGRTVRGKYCVPEPAAFAAAALSHALASRGVAMDVPPLRRSVTDYDFRGTVALHRSPPLREAVKIVLKVSQNLHAEMLARAGDSFKAVREFVQKYGIAGGAHQGDGCGAAGTFTPRFMCRLLAGASREPFADAFVDGLPVLGRDGTLCDVQTHTVAAANSAIKAKTGTMGYFDRLAGGEFISAKGLAGYIRTARGSSLTFALYGQNVPGTAHEAGEILGEIAVAAYETL